MFIMMWFHSTLPITISCCRAVPDDKFEVQIDPTCTKVGFTTSALSRGDRIWRKGTSKFSCSHLVVYISLRLARPGQQLLRETTSVKVSFCSTLQGRKKGWCIGRKQESIFESEVWTYTTQILCFSRFYLGKSHGPPRDQVRASIFILFLVLQSRKQVAEPHPCFQCILQIESLWMTIVAVLCSKGQLNVSGCGC